MRIYFLYFLSHQRRALSFTSLSFPLKGSAYRVKQTSMMAFRSQQKQFFLAEAGDLGYDGGKIVARINVKNVIDKFNPCEKSCN
jgi:hypothetical protein